MDISLLIIQLLNGLQLGVLLFLLASGLTLTFGIMDLVNLAGELGETLKTLVRLPLIGGLLRAMRAPAHATGFGALQEFLETGFVTFREIPDIDRFLELLVARLDEVFQRIYVKPIADIERT